MAVEINGNGVIISINEFRGDYFFLSNFYEIPVTYNRITYQNSEAAFQAQKTFLNRERFTDLKPSQAKKLGLKVDLRPDWEEIKYGVMFEVVLSKFEQHPDLLQKLLDTGDAHLEEGNTWGDRTWGTVKGKGKNQLGNILMYIRYIKRNNIPHFKYYEVQFYKGE